jgi:hypothetical protein
VALLQIFYNLNGALLLLWRSWQVRNNITHDTEKLSIVGSVRFLQKYWLEVCSVRQREGFDPKGKRAVVDSLVAGRKDRPAPVELRWEAPDPGRIKVNMDGAFDAHSREGGVGIVARDNAGSVVFTAWKYIARGEDAEELEAMACKEGLVLASEWCRVVSSWSRTVYP